MRPVTATIHLGHLAHNYQLLQQQAGDRDIMAVVKANAYGHGLLPIAAALLEEGCRSFAVTDAEEGMRLRLGFPQDTHSQALPDIILLSGIFDADDATWCAEYQLTPVLSEPWQFHLLQAQNFSGKIWLKADTGMYRMGADNIDDFIKQIEQSSMHLAGLMSHLACADTPDHAMNQSQLQRFQALQQTISPTKTSLLNSAGIIAMPAHASNMVRPGIALYGDEPVRTMPLGLKPVMQLSAKIVQIRPINAGESVSYGATWQAPHATHIAVVCAGYADGVPRLLSNQGHAAHASGLLPIAGRVCMDYCMLAVDVDQVSLGDDVIFFGYSSHAPWLSDVAAQCQTISYELLTSIGARVHRQYIRE